MAVGSRREGLNLERLNDQCKVQSNGLSQDKPSRIYDSRCNSEPSIQFLTAPGQREKDVKTPLETLAQPGPRRERAWLRLKA